MHVDPFKNKYNSPGVMEARHNYGTSDIPNGTFVCQAWDLTDTDQSLENLKICNGVEVPDAANVKMAVGVVQCGNGKALPAGGDGEVVREGIARALVYLPANTGGLTTVPAGTFLVLGSEWNALYTAPVFGRTVSTVRYGCLEPLVFPSDICATPVDALCPPANPWALLLEDLTPAAAVSCSLANVYVLPHKPVMMAVSKFLAVPADAENILLTPCLGPGEVCHAAVQQLTPGTTAGGVAYDVRINPRYAGGGKDRSVYQSSKAPFVPQDATDADMCVYGVGGKADGNTTTPGWGTAARHGLLLAALASRQFISREALTLLTTVGSTVPAKSHATVSVLYY